MSENFRSAPSSAERPDLDWSQVRETVSMLRLALAQIEAGIHEGNESMEVLAAGLTTMIEGAQTIGTVVANLPEGPERRTIEERTAAMLGRMHSTLEAVQFHDRLSQRLDHVATSLGSLAEIVSTPERLYNPAEWRHLQELIRSRYTMEGERAMFEALLAGASIEEALEASRQAASQIEEESIELF